MEKVLQQILEELRELRQGQEELRLGQEAQGQELKELRLGQEIQGQELKELRQGQEFLIKRVDNLEHGQTQVRRSLEAQGEELKAQGAKIDNLQTDLTRLALHVEGEITDKIRALYDSREVLNDTLTSINRRLDEYERRQDLHWHEITVLKTKRRP